MAWTVTWSGLPAPMPMMKIFRMLRHRLRCATVVSHGRAAAALLCWQVTGIGVARRRRPGQFDQRHDPPAGTVELADDQALVFDIGQKPLGAAERVRAISPRDRRIAWAWPAFLGRAGDHHEHALHVFGQDRGPE